MPAHETQFKVVVVFRIAVQSRYRRLCHYIEIRRRLVVDLQAEHRVQIQTQIIVVDTLVE